MKYSMRAVWVSVHLDGSIIIGTVGKIHIAYVSSLLVLLGLLGMILPSSF